MLRCFVMCCTILSCAMSFCAVLLHCVLCAMLFFFIMAVRVRVFKHGFHLGAWYGALLVCGVTILVQLYFVIEQPNIEH